MHDRIKEGAQGLHRRGRAIQGHGSAGPRLKEQNGRAHTPEEFEIMKTHTTIGARTLQGVGERYPRNSFVTMGAEIASSHHERRDGTGYPRGIAGDTIPLPAQIMSIADVYDALRTPRRYKPGFSHGDSVRIMTVGDGRTKPSHFGPRILPVFAEVAKEFDAIYDRLKS